MYSLRAVSPSIPLAAFAFAAAHVAFEYFNGGVKTHHFLARADLPGFSNWLGLFILPMLGIVLAVRAKSAQGGQASSILPPALATGMWVSLAYGAALAASFHFGLEQVSLVLFTGLFLLSIVGPVYRAEYSFGFVIGMTITFGSVIPLAFALFFGTISFALRHAAVFVLSAVRKRRR
jgi:hypothetical protein